MLAVFKYILGCRADSSDQSRNSKVLFPLIPGVLGVNPSQYDLAVKCLNHMGVVGKVGITD